MTTFRWEDPPAITQTRANYRAEIDLLTEDIGRWAVVYETDNSLQAHWHRRNLLRVAKTMDINVEATVRTIGNFELTTSKVYARRMS